MLDGKWKLVSRFPDQWELYDLEADRSELHDLAARDQARVARIESDPLSISVGQLFQVLAALGVRVTLDPVASAPVSAVLPALTAQVKITAGKAAEKTDPAPRNADW